MVSRSIWLVLAVVVANGLLVWGVASYNNYLKRVAPPVEDVDVRSPAADQRFGRLSNWFVLFYLVLTVVFSVLMYFLLELLAGWWSSMLPAAEMSVLCSSPSLWQLVAFFAAIGLTALWSGPIMRTMWPDAGGFFSTYLSVRRYGCDHDKLCRGLSFPLVLIATVCFVLGSNSYVQARGSLIAERSFFSLHENTYEYSEIKSIETGETRLGRGYGRDYFIAFRDGTGFDFYKRLPSGGESERRKLAEVISKKSGVPITEVSRF